MFSDSLNVVCLKGVTQSHNYEASCPGPVAGGDVNILEAQNLLSATPKMLVVVSKFLLSSLENCRLLQSSEAFAHEPCELECVTRRFEIFARQTSDI